MRIGFAGMGKMGAAMAARLAEQGQPPAVWNRTRARADATGLVVVDTPSALAERTDIILTSLFDDAAAEAVFHGTDGLLATDLAGKLIIEMSTLRPHTQVALAEAVRARGGAAIECPVGGTTGPARAGTLLGLAGGAADDVTRARPVLDVLCRRVEHVGGHGAAASLKLAINLPLLVFWQSFGEANALVRHLGLDPAWLVELFADTSGAPAVLKNRGKAIAATLAGAEPGAVTFDIDSIRKDLSTMVAEAGSRNVALPAASAALASFDDASAAGWGERDCTWLPAFWASKADHQPS
ncbi:MAG: NAD(P)-dependent oxidoreductase [Janthinobacterium lividum]